MIMLGPFVRHFVIEFYWKEEMEGVDDGKFYKCNFTYILFHILLLFKSKENFKENNNTFSYYITSIDIRKVLIVSSFLYSL